jgi:cytochrome c oxidase cbb3-type subunit 3
VVDWEKLGCACVLATCACLAACQAEKRQVGPPPPLTPPVSAADPRIHAIETNAWQVSQGGRLFGWFGCQSCHGEAAQGALDLADNQWRHGGEAQEVYRSIAGGRPGMPAYGDLTADELWQLTAYVRSLGETRPSKRRRQDVDLAAEPSGVSPREAP